MNRIAWFIVALTLASSPASAESVYKWKDAQGRIHYSNEPPPKETGAAKVRLVIPSFSGEAVVSTVDRRPGDVVLFGTSTCGYCKEARRFLMQKRIPYTDHDVVTDEAAAAEFRKLGGRGVPVILVGSQRMDGFNAGRLAEMLRNAGYP